MRWATDKRLLAARSSAPDPRREGNHDVPQSLVQQEPDGPSTLEITHYGPMTRERFAQIE
jgi:hypothetical protein